MKKNRRDRENLGSVVNKRETVDVVRDFTRGVG